MIQNKRNSGFTLIEILVVVFIIIILASILLVMITSSKKRAADADFKSVVNSAHKAYIAECTEQNGDITSISLSGGVTRGATSNCNSGRFSVELIPPTGVSSSCTLAVVDYDGIDFSDCP